LNKPKKQSIQQNQPIPDADRLLKKELLMAYSAFTSFAKLLEQMQGAGVKKAPMRRIARAARKEVHLDRAIVSSETWTERDRVCRRLAKFCFDLAKYFLRIKDYRDAQRWMALSHCYLKLAMDPKKLQDMDQIEKELAELKTAMKEREEKQGEEDLEEPGDS
jgi:hypothetical protein